MAVGSSTAQTVTAHDALHYMHTPHAALHALETAMTSHTFVYVPVLADLDGGRLVDGADGDGPPHAALHAHTTHHTLHYMRSRQQ